MYWCFYLDNISPNKNLFPPGIASGICVNMQSIHSFSSFCYDLSIATQSKIDNSPDVNMPNAIVHAQHVHSFTQQNIVTFAQRYMRTLDHTHTLGGECSYALLSDTHSIVWSTTPLLEWKRTINKTREQKCNVHFDSILLCNKTMFLLFNFSFSSLRMYFLYCILRPTFVFTVLVITIPNVIIEKKFLISCSFWGSIKTYMLMSTKELIFGRQRGKFLNCYCTVTV